MLVAFLSARFFKNRHFALLRRLIIQFNNDCSLLLTFLNNSLGKVLQGHLCLVGYQESH